MKMTKLIAVALVLAISVFPAAINAAKCGLAGLVDKKSCWGETDPDTGLPCVWCYAIHGRYRTCLPEIPAETIEYIIPQVHCLRKHDSDIPDGIDFETNEDHDDLFFDDKNDDAVDDDGDDDNIEDDATDDDNNDDDLPKDYWICLQQKDSTACHNPKYNCTWCNTKGGYGVCMDGPSAESAKTSYYFQCEEDSKNENVSSMLRLGNLRTKPEEGGKVSQNPMSTACMLTFLQDPSKDACLAAMDSDGSPCEFCVIQGFEVCMNTDQAALAEQAGATCGTEVVAGPTVNDPLDTTCTTAFLQDHSKEACLNTVDSGGNACQFCHVQFFDICLNAEQAASLSQGGVVCERRDIVAANDPMDPACLQAFLVDQTQDACLAAVDSNGNGCEFCAFQGYEVCLNVDQAAYMEQVGGTCQNVAVAVASALNDPLDATCTMTYLDDKTKDTCLSTVDSDGNACEFCSIDGVDFCFDVEQAEVAKQAGGTCVTQVVEAPVNDPLDATCTMTYLDDKTKDTCLNTVDSDGNACEFCSIDGVDFCFDVEQAEVAKQAGGTCVTQAVESQYLPSTVSLE